MVYKWCHPDSNRSAGIFSPLLYLLSYDTYKRKVNTTIYRHKLSN